MLTAAEAKKELFGVDLFGTVEGRPDYRWRECIDAKGFTLYQHDGVEERGQLTINERGEACFSYPPGNKNRTNCFSARKTAKGYDFQGFGLLFHATMARRVETCGDQKVSAAGTSSHGG